MIARQFTFISEDMRESFSVIGSDQQDVTNTAFQLAGHMPLPCAVVCKPINFKEAPCAR